MEFQWTLKDDAIKVLHSICQHIWKAQQWPQDWRRSRLILVPKKGSTKESANHRTIALISHASKVMLKILHARLQHYANKASRCPSLVQKRQRNQRSDCRNSRKTSSSVSLTTLKPLTVWIIINCRKFLEMRIPDHLTCLLRNLYVGQEATVRTLYGTTDSFIIEKELWQACLLSPCLFNLYSEHIM